MTTILVDGVPYQPYQAAPRHQRRATRRLTKRHAAIGVIVTGLFVGATACSSNPGGAANRAEQNQQDQVQGMRDANQPIPIRPFSEKRDVAIAIANAQQTGVATTTFFFTQGVDRPDFSCPSIGFPLPGTTQLTNPKRVIFNYVPGSGSSYANDVIDQMDPDGTYPGTTNSMYVECVDPSGKTYVVHDGLGTPKTIGAPAHWDDAKHSIVIDGAPTALTPGKKEGP